MSKNFAMYGLLIYQGSSYHLGVRVWGSSCHLPLEQGLLLIENGSLGDYPYSCYKCGLVWFVRVSVFLHPPSPSFSHKLPSFWTANRGWMFMEAGGRAFGGVMGRWWMGCKNTRGWNDDFWDCGWSLNWGLCWGSHGSGGGSLGQVKSQKGAGEIKIWGEWGPQIFLWLRGQLGRSKSIMQIWSWGTPVMAPTVSLPPLLKKKHSRSSGG